MRQIKDFWIQALIGLVGVAAVAVLATVPFRPCESLDQTEEGSAVSPAGQPHWDTVDRERAMAREQGLQSIPCLLKKVRHRQANLERTIAALSTLGPAAVPTLAARLDDRSDAVRLVATRTIACLGLRTQLEPQAGKVMPALIRRLRDRRVEVRYAAILALLNFGPSREQAIPGLIAVLRDTNGLSKGDLVCIQQGAAYVLRKLGPNAKAAIPALNWLLHDETSHARNTAATALWRISCDTNLVLLQLCSMLAETNSSARCQAAAALEWINREIELSPELMAEVGAVKRRPGEPLTLAEAP